jgi:hypothetical protein
LDGRLKNCYNQQQQQHSRESGPCSTLLPYRYEYYIIPVQGPYLPDKSSSKIKEEGATNTPPLLLLACLLVVFYCFVVVIPRRYFSSF